MSAVQHLIESRISANAFDTHRPVTTEQIEELIRLATLAPSAYNFQNWKFIAVTSNAAKEKLKAAAYGQQKVVDAAGGCARFCVNGKSIAGCGLHVRKHNDNQKARSTSRTTGQPAGQLQEA